MSRIVKAGTITVDGKTYQLKLDLAAIMDFEEQSGKLFLQVVKPVFDAVATIRNKDVLDAVKSIVGGGGSSADIDIVETTAFDAIDAFMASGAISAKDVATLLWAATGGTESELTIRDAAKLIRVDNVVEVLRELFASVGKTLPIADPDESKDDSETDNNPNS